MYQWLKSPLRALFAGLAVAAAGWALAVWLLGGIRTSLITASSPWRAVVLAAGGAILYVFSTGPAHVRQNLRARGRRLITPLALILALCPAVAGLARNSWTAGGADSYAYVSQADLWLHSRLKTPVPIASSAPWPKAIWTFTPHGYRPSVDQSGIVPVTAPGLPLMMAAATIVAGHCAMFWVTPLSGALLVFMTFAIGRRLGSSSIGLAAAWLVATSPAVLAMLVSPMSDVPAAAFWATAIFFALGDSSGAAVAAGLASSAAILVRPNLAPLAVVIVCWTIVVRLKPDTTDTTPSVVSAFRRTALLAAGLAPGCLLVAWVNQRLYGSPFSSGYGDVNALFSLGNVGLNFRQYGRWLIESQTPLAVLGIAALVIPARSMWPTRRWQHAAWLLAGFVGVVWVLYCIYTPFDAWWYLRFLLPCWPAICLGSATLVVRLAEHRHVLWRIAAVAVLAAAGAHGIYFAAHHAAFPSGEGDHRYVSIAMLVEQYTDPHSVIITGQNAGAIRYYGGRTTLRFDYLDEAWLDRAVQWLADHGRRPYFLLEEWEVPVFQQRFAGRNTLGAVALAPVLAYHAPGVPGSVFLFDPARADGPTARPVPPPAARAKCVEPAPAPALN